MYDVVFNFKGTVYVISISRVFKEWLFRLTTIPFTILLPPSVLSSFPHPSRFLPLFIFFHPSPPHPSFILSSPAPIHSSFSIHPLLILYLSPLHSPFIPSSYTIHLLFFLHPSFLLPLSIFLHPSPLHPPSILSSPPLVPSPSFIHRSSASSIHPSPTFIHPSSNSYLGCKISNKSVIRR